MSDEQKRVIRTFFELAIHKKNGTEFQNFFQDIMERRNIGFISVAPQGRRGDGGNDGMIPDEGKYFQCYAPVNAEDKVQYAIKKLEDDFVKLKSNWDAQYCKIKEYIYVFKNKYQGIYPDILMVIKDLEKKYKPENVSFKLFLAKNLEDEFMKLDEVDMSSCLGTFLPPNDLNFDAKYLQDVIQFLVKNYQPFVDSDFPDNIDLVKKIQFNRVGKVFANYLKLGSYYEADLQKYFKLNSNFVEEQLSIIFKQYYKEAKEEYANLENLSDKILASIWSRATPNPYLSQISMILISHYFEICDILEEPTNEFQMEYGQLRLNL